MGFLSRLTAACLRAAARRWPADLRDDLAREWAAELDELERRPGTAGRRLAFAISLAITPLSFDEEGAPRGGWEWLRAGAALRSASQVALAGAFGMGLAMVIRSILGESLLDFGDSGNAWLLIGALANSVVAALVTGYAVVAGRWIGRRGAPDPGPAGSLGVAATVVLPLAALLSFFLLVRTEGIFVNCLLAAGCWALLTMLLVAATVRALSAGRRARARLLAVLGVPLAAALPDLPLHLGSVVDLPIYLLVSVISTIGLLLPWTVFAVVFARATVRRWTTAVVPVEPEVEPVAAGPVDAQPPWWRLTVERFVLAGLAAAGAAAWAVGVTVLQPLSEPAHLQDATGENNTYWARELRWGALFAVILVLLVWARGDRRATRAVLLGGLLWLVADIQLDRIDPTSGTVMLAAVTAVAALGACAAVGMLPSVPRHRVLLTVALIAAVMSALATETESPTDVERALNLGSAAVGSLLAMVAVAAATRAAGAVSPFRGAVALVLGALAGAGPWLIRLRHPQPDDVRFQENLLLLVLLLVAVVVLAGPRPRHRRDWLRLPASAALAVVVVPAVLVPLLFACIALPIAALFTALAGNPPVNGADTDLIAVLIAIPTGLVAGRLPLTRPFRPRGARAARPVAHPRPLLVPPDPS
ncbi:hypothetical protein BJY16_008515 [Actinoplanes octamycinicus]|uniref:Uncharacterized protein n=1 Tax=Actinoplanes octamycinicus TaxID=135948 RepID=A0A7W7H6S3_9ACTN|nr:hypothetical protein [Actinoplanes octamycinicus]MBB4745056.1 hypothetical protein [Actinoplanes octamycinicus]